eukprot:jgi/Tetstr1/431317/TSEL_021009.t1
MAAAFVAVLRLPFLAVAVLLLLAAVSCTAAESDEDPLFHTIINTDCSPYSDWMAEGFIYTHFTSNTAGGLTRIVSCDNPDYVYPKIWHPRMRMQFTPDFKKQTMPNGEEDNFVHYNRVIGMEYWLNDQGRDLHPDTVIVMADADFVLYAPLHKAFQDRNGASVVQHGQPAGQIYLIGSQWFKQRGCAEWMREQCGEACGDNTAEAVDLHYMVGAPLAMTKMDWLKMYPAYTYYTKRFRQSSQGGVDDMFGYVLAAMHHGLRHKSATEIMISDPKSIHAEGWHFIDGMTPDGRSLRRANESRHYRINFHPDGHTAPILHYCQNNEPGHGLEFGSHIRFSKYEWNRAPLGLPTCDPLPEYRYDNDKLDKIIANQSIPDMARRHAFMVRWVPSALYRALQHYQAIACGDDELDGTSQQPGAAATNGGPAPIQQVNNDAAEVERLSRASRAIGVKSRGRPLFGTQRQKTVKAEGL